MRSQIFILLLRKIFIGNLSDKLKNFIPLVVDLSQSQGKQIIFAIEDASFKVNLLKYKGVLNACTHILRNAVDHGIETPRKRGRRKKLNKA